MHYGQDRCNHLHGSLHGDSYDSICFHASLIKKLRYGHTFIVQLTVCEESFLKYHRNTVRICFASRFKKSQRVRSRHTSLSKKFEMVFFYTWIDVIQRITLVLRQSICLLFVRLL